MKTKPHIAIKKPLLPASIKSTHLISNPMNSIIQKRYISFDPYEFLHTLVRSKEFLTIMTGFIGYIIRDIYTKRKNNNIRFTLAAKSDEKELPKNIEKLIEEANINLVDGDGNSALHYICTTGNLELAKLLFLHGCDLNTKNKHGETPLFNAAFHGHTPLINEFVNAVTQYSTGWVWGFKNQIFKTTIKNIVNEKNYRSWSPFLAAAFNKHTEAAIFLHSLGAKVDIANDNNETALYWAVMNNDLDLVRYILFHANLSQEILDELLSTDISFGLGTPLHAAANQGFVEIARLLLEANKASSECDIKNIRAGKYSRTPLHEAALKGDVDMIQLLLEYDANPALKLKDGRNAFELLLISSSGQYPAKKAKEFERCKELILSKNDYLKTRYELHQTFLQTLTVDNVIETANSYFDGHENTLMHILAIANKSDLIKKLGERFPLLINQPNRYGCTPVYEAAAFGSLDTVKTLLELGADINLARSGGWTPLCVAALAKNFKIIEFVLTHYKDKVKNIDQKNEWGETPFYWAIQRQDFNSIKIIVENGARLTQTDRNGHGCLHHLAKIKGSADIIIFLLKDKKLPLPVNQLTKKHLNTPLHTGAKYNNRPFILEMKKYGASIFFRNGSGKLPYQLTTDPEIKQLLLPPTSSENDKKVELKR